MTTQAELPFVGLPAATPSADVILKREIQEWSRVAAEWGPLVLPSIAANAVGISKERVSQLVSGGKINVWTFFAREWVSLPEVQFHVTTAHKRVGGRPKKAA